MCGSCLIATTQLLPMLVLATPATSDMPRRSVVWSAEQLAGEMHDQVRRANGVLMATVDSVWSIDIGHGVTFDVLLGQSSKGNGSIELANLWLRIYDIHDDGYLYANKALNVTFIDMNGDSYLDLVVEGPVIVTGDKGDDQSMTSLCTIFEYVPEAKLFKAVFRQGPNILEVGEFGEEGDFTHN